MALGAAFLALATTEVRLAATCVVGGSRWARWVSTSLGAVLKH